MQLLFCNTFSYDAQGPSGNWAVVKFPCMVAVDEVRIIAPGTRVHSKLQDDQFVGKTTPSKFRIEFFSDDRSVSMTTYDHVGYLDYLEGSHNIFRPSSALYSEKLLLNGWFNYLTIAVYGGILSDITSGPPALDINAKAPSLIIQEKPEGRSVYIRGAPDLPQLIKDVDKPEPLMANFPPSNKGYSRLPESSGQRKMGYQDSNRTQDMHSSFYDRRRGRGKSFGSNIDTGRSQHAKPYLDLRSHGRNIDPNMSEYGNDDGFSYKDRSRQMHGPPHQRPYHHHHDANDVADIHKPKGAGDSYQYNDNEKREVRVSQDSKREGRSPRQSFEQSREESVNLNEQDKDRNQEWVDGEFEEISDEETEEERLVSLDIEDELEPELLSPGSVCFNPYLLEPLQLMHFTHPALTEFEVMCNMLLGQQEDSHQINGNEEDVMRFESLVTKAKKIGKLTYSDSPVPILLLKGEEGKDWVAVMEEIVPLITTALPLFGITSREKYDEYLLLLVAWIFAGLDSTLASTQAIGINLRLLKCGINLAHKLCLTTQDIVALLTDSKIDDKLFDLLQMDSMASSVRIMIIHTLDAYLSWPLSVGHYFQDDGSTNQNYVKLIELALQPQAARVATALSRLMNKLALFHAMWRLKNTVQFLVTEKIPVIDDDMAGSDDEFMVEESDDIPEGDVEEDEEMVVMSSTSNDEDDDEVPIHTMHSVSKASSLSCENDIARHSALPAADIPAPIPLEAIVSASDAEISQSDVDEIVESLELIIYTFKHTSSTITQLPKKAFPTSSDFGAAADKNTMASLFRMLEFYQVLSSLQALITSPVISAVEDVFEVAYKYFDLLMSRQDGILYLASNSCNICCISKHLLCSGSSGQEIETMGTAAHLGVKLAFHIQCIQCIDQLKMIPELENTKMEGSDEAIEILRILYSLTYPSYGKWWVAHIMSLEDNILPLLAFIQRSKEEDMVEKQLLKGDDEHGEEEKKDDKHEPSKKKPVRKTATGGFAINTLLTVLKMSENVSHLFLFRAAVLDTLKYAPMGRYVEEVHEWLRPLEIIADGKPVVQIMEYIKTSFSKLEWNTLMTSGPGQCTSLRLLRYLSNVSANDNIDDTKSSGRKTSPATYQAALEVFSAGGLTTFVEGLEQLNKCFEYPCYSQHALTTVFSLNFHNLVTSLSQNLLSLIKHFLNILLSTGDGKFQCDNLTKLLVRHYSGMYSILRESGLEKLDTITETIVSIFGIFISKSIDTDSDDSEKLSNRDIILRELVSTTQEQCQAMVPGLILLSHLLPMPLPVCAIEDITDDDVNSVSLQRQSWEQPLEAILPDFTGFLTVACHSTCIPLLEVLIPLVQQMIDLSPSVGKSVMSAVVKACMHEKVTTPVEVKESEKTDESEKTKEIVYTYSPHPIMVLAEIAVLPIAKAALIHCMQENKHAFDSLWDKAISLKREKSLRLLDAAVRLTSVLVDVEDSPISHNFEESTFIKMTKLACEGLTSSTLSTKLDSVATLRSVTQTEHCFKEVKYIFLKHASLLTETLKIISQHSGDDSSLSAAVLIHVCMFLKELASPEGERQSFLSKSELKAILKWDGNSKHHPLSVIRSKLEKMEENNRLFDLALNEVSTLCGNLKSSQDVHRKVKDKSKKSDIKKKAMVDPQSLEDHYNQRPRKLSEDDNTALLSRLCILQGNSQNSFASRNISRHEKVQVNLTEIADKSCPGFNLEKSFKDLTESAKTTDIDKIRMEAKAKRLKKLETFSTRHGKTLTFIKRSHGIYSSTSRGRGRGRGTFSGRHYDLFRQRKQNTSRPPSMHVDDFVAADEEDSNTGDNEFVTPAPPAPSFAPQRRTLPFKRDFIPRGRGSRGAARGLGTGRGSFSSFIGTGANTEPLSGIDKFRSRPLGSRPQDRFPRGRGRGRDPTRSFSPRGGFTKPKNPQSWSFSPRNDIGTSFGSPGGFRGGRVKSLMRIGRPLLPHPSLGFNKWGDMPPPPRRGRGYGKPRGKHIRSFTR